jgi:hypothetical protein
LAQGSTVTDGASGRLSDAGQVSEPRSSPLGYWSSDELAAYLGVSRWTIQRRVKADPAFPVLRGWGPDRFPIDRVKAYLQRQEQGRGRAYKSRSLLSFVPQPPDVASSPSVESGS